MKTIIKLNICIATAGLFASCQTCKIEPPPSVIGTNKEISAKAAANALGSAISGGEVSGSYKNAVNNTYQTVGQDDIAFYILMQGYNCESARGHAAAAAEILTLARQELARRHEAQVPTKAAAVMSTQLTRTEKKVLKNSPSPLKEEVKKTIETPKAAPAPSPAASPAAKKTKSKGKAQTSPSPTP